MAVRRSGSTAKSKQAERKHTSIRLTEEAKKLSDYVRKARRIKYRVVRLYETASDGSHLKKLVWSSFGDDELGPVRPPPGAGATDGGDVGADDIQPPEPEE